MALPDNKFRGRPKPVLDDYLHLSQSTSASLTYDSVKKKHTLTSELYDAFTGEKISTNTRVFTMKQARNRASASLEREQNASASRASADKMIVDMKRNMGG